MKPKKYKVEITGFVYVEAYDEEEAIEKAKDEYDEIYREIGYINPVEIDEFVVEI